MTNHPKALLARFGIEPKKSLGQNFLFDDLVLASIVEIAEVGLDDEVLEVGAGLGHLTAHLATAAGRVVALEIDQRLVPVLQSQLAGHDNIELVAADILNVKPADFFDGAYIVVANIPYYISGAILRHLLESRPRPARLVLTVQEEVAARLTAEPGDLTLLAVSVQLYGTVSRVLTLKAGTFWPSPKVDSAVVRIDLYDRPPLSDEELLLFFRLVKAGFAQKRKQLQKNLRNIVSSRQRIYQALGAANIDPRRRAQTLSVQEWLALHRALKGGSKSESNH